ncbi:J domain-containing protein [Allocoleopsis franciscana]|uniref:DnaJ-class molecular chaperone with C-terminal Zn finger domain n=1 Tax=Allocoleopsis franciscana PCC 7113 TaxID=1173027 RepID=K9WLS7_9CYAN|nr:J domain-containing protein [Allocoleopsis franciscana]AFZ21118.1 DnaJ-class molecular chaperone with C-terminal Zn finger domain [Allocoleopsis franciscana PCC 7113]
MSASNHYDTLNISSQATSAEIKQAYRRLAKLFHPDSKSETADSDKIIEVNAAYEVLSDPKRRRSYDEQLRSSPSTTQYRNRQQRTADAQQKYQRHRQTAQDADFQLSQWLQLVYKPVTRLIRLIVRPLNAQVDELALDPFDDELMANFQAYLEECRNYLNQAQLTFRSQPNPPTVAGAAASLYYCLNQLGDGIEELNFFTLNYDDHYLHVGQELFRIATGLHYEAQDALRELAQKV